MKFQCTKCSLCCKKKHLDEMPLLIGATLPRKSNGDCLHLKKNGQCAIYRRRPMVCRNKDSFDLFSEMTGVSTLKEWYVQGNEKCNKMQEAEGLDPKFRIDVSVYDVMAT